MKKTNWKYLVDAILFICIVGLALIGFVLGFVVPKGPAVSENAKYFLGLHRHQWGDIHLYLGIIFTVMAVLHLVLAWDWVKGKTRQLFGEKWKAVLIAAPVAAMVILALFWVYFAENPNLYEDHGRQSTSRVAHPAPMGGEEVLITGQMSRGGRRERPVEEHTHDEPMLTRGRNAEVTAGVLITGQVSLYDIERQTGVSAQAIANRLRIPSGVSLDERLGWLRRSYGFTMQEVREAVSTLMTQD